MRRQSFALTGQWTLRFQDKRDDDYQTEGLKHKGWKWEKSTEWEIADKKKSRQKL